MAAAANSGHETTSMRIASLLSAATEILYSLGMGEHIVAVSHECDFPADVNAKPRVTRSNIDSAQSSDQIDRQVHDRIAAGAPLYEIDAEQLAKLAPDLIVTQAQCDVCAVRYADVVDLVRSRPELQHAKIVALNPQSLDDVLSDILRIGEAAGAIDRAVAVVSKQRARISTVARSFTALAETDRPKVALIEWIEPLMLAGNWVPELIRLAGGRCDLTKSGIHSAYTEWSALEAYDPDVIVVAPCGFDLDRTRLESQSLLRHPNWPRLFAVRNGRVFIADGNAYFNRSGPRLVDSLELLAHFVHPQQFPSPDWPQSHVFEPLV
jgi:iron complex transport system substrate-binding protein